MGSNESTTGGSGDGLAELRGSLGQLVEAVVARESEGAEREFEHVYERVRELVARKLGGRGTKSETRDLIGELVFSRLQRGLRTLVDSAEAESAMRAAQWVMGATFGQNALAEFAVAFDRAILEVAAPREYSFAGMTDFISIEEVMQLLGSGGHIGCLTFERPENRIDIYLAAGRIAFLDPHHLSRRMLPGNGPMNYREISTASLREAEQMHVAEEKPLFLALHEKGIFKDMNVRSVMTELGIEAFLEFLMSRDPVFFSYKRLAQLPPFAQQHDLRIGVTGILLECNKRLDDWRSLHSVFPDPDAPIEPMPDMYSRIGGLDLGIVEIKLLAHINGKNSAEAIARAIGLPLTETYQHLVRLAREGAVVPAGGPGSLNDVSMSVEESMKLAFEALDANDDQLAVASALDKVLGGDGLFGGDNDVADPAEDSGVHVSLDFLKARRRTV